MNNENALIYKPGKTVGDVIKSAGLTEDAEPSEAFVLRADGSIVARPMMYLALSYDHRMIDGKEAVQFLVTVKDLLEDPARIFLEV